MNLELRSVRPHELDAAALADPRSVLACRFDEPPSPAELAARLRPLASAGTTVDAADIRTIRHERAVTNSTALSLASLAPHTDGAFLATPPRGIVLSCTVADTAGGGASTLIPVNFVRDAAPGWVLDALTKARYRFVRTYDGDTADAFVGPVLRQDADGELRIRWRSDHLHRPAVVDANGTRAADAVEWLHALLESCEPFTYLLRDGELLLIPNDLVIHGRRALSAGSQRELLRGWIF